MGNLKGKKILITAGPTREFIDPVRFISNPSTGRMGIAIAQAVKSAGADVTLILGPAEVQPLPEIKTIKVKSIIDSSSIPCSFKRRHRLKTVRKKPIDSPIRYK